MIDRRTGLLELLARHVPADDVERAHLSDVRALVSDPGDPFDRGRYDPGHVTASAFVVSPDGTAILLVHHRKLGRWLQPGGHVERDDPDVPAAARREVIEETGLGVLVPLGTGLLDVDVHAIPARKDERAHRHFDVRVAFRATTSALSPGAEVAGARWVPLDAVTEEGADASVLRAVARLRRWRA